MREKNVNYHAKKNKLEQLLITVVQMGGLSFESFIYCSIFIFKPLLATG